MKRNDKSGFSLVEVMVSMLVLAALVVGSAAVVYHAAGGIQRQQNKREGIVAVNEMMDSVWNQTYADLRQKQNTISTRNISVNHNTIAVTIAISAEATDLLTGEKFIQITLNMDPTGTGDHITLESRRYAYGLSKVRI